VAIRPALGSLKVQGRIGGKSGELLEGQGDLVAVRALVAVPDRVVVVGRDPHHRAVGAVVQLGPDVVLPVPLDRDDRVQQERAVVEELGLALGLVRLAVLPWRRGEVSGASIWNAAPVLPISSS
jgi:hypothetical protein